MTLMVRPPGSSSTSPTTTVAPAFAIRCATSAPIPRAAPEIRATLPSRRFIGFPCVPGRVDAVIRIGEDESTALPGVYGGKVTAWPVHYYSDGVRTQGVFPIRDTGRRRNDRSADVA